MAQTANDGEQANASIAGMKSAPNLILIGPMGSGKSSIGRRLAQRLGLPFVDVDRKSSATGASIPLIFELKEKKASERRDVLARICAGHGQVIATGGARAAARQPRTDADARFVVHLSVTLDNQLRRLAQDRNRPLLQHPTGANACANSVSSAPRCMPPSPTLNDTASGVRQAVGVWKPCCNNWRAVRATPPRRAFRLPPRWIPHRGPDPIRRLDVELGRAATRSGSARPARSR